MRRETIWTVAAAVVLVGLLGGIFGDIPLRTVYRIIDSVWPRALVIGIPLGLALGALVLLVARPATLDRGSALAFILGMTGAAVCTTQIVVKVANGALDHTPASPLRAVVVKIGGGKNASVLRVTDAGPFEGRTVYVPRTDLPRATTPALREAREGDRIVLLAHPGRLGLAWWREIQADLPATP